MEVSDWVSIVALATSFITYLDTKKSANKATAVQALTYVIEASEKTQTYLVRRANGAQRDREVEWELAEMWSIAAFQISRINQDLSIRLNAKSRFWRDPETWDTTLRAAKDIGLASVTNEARRVMQSYV